MRVFLACASRASRRVSGSYSRVSCTTVPPSSSSSICRCDLVVDRLLARSGSEFRFLISRARAELGCARPAHRDVGVAAERAFLHVAVADVEPAHERVQRLARTRPPPRPSACRARRRSRAAACRRGSGRCRSCPAKSSCSDLPASSSRCARVRRDALRRAVAEHDLDAAALHDRQLVLADLVALRQVGIEVVLAREDRARRDRARRPRGRSGSPFDRAAVEHRQHAREREVDQARLRVRRARRSAVDEPREDLRARSTSCAWISRPMTTSQPHQCASLIAAYAAGSRAMPVGRLLVARARR